MADDNLNKAVTLIKSGRLSEARALLLAILKDNPRDEMAWLWLTETSMDDADRIAALQECLKYNPDSAVAQMALEHIKARLTADLPGHQTATTVGQPTITPPPTPSTRPEPQPTPVFSAPVEMTSIISGREVLRTPAPKKSKYHRKRRFHLSRQTIILAALSMLVLCISVTTVFLWNRFRPKEKPKTAVTPMVLTITAAARELATRQAGFSTLTPAPFSAPTLTATPPPSITPQPVTTPTYQPIHLPLLGISGPGEIISSEGLQPIYSLFFSPDNQTLLWAANERINIWDIETKTILKSFDIPNLQAIALSPDGSSLVTATSTGELTLLDITDGKVILQLFGDLSPYSLAFNLDGRYIFSEVGVWETSTGELLLAWELPSGDPRMNHFAFHPNGQVVMASGPDRTLRLSFDPTTNEFGEWEEISSASASGFNPSGTILAVAQGQIELKNFTSGKSLLSLEPAGMFFNLQFSPNGTMVAAGTGEMEENTNVIYLWDVTTGVLRATLQTDEPVTALNYNSDGTRLAAGSASGSIWLWDTSDPLAIARGLQVETAQGFDPYRLLRIPGPVEGFRDYCENGPYQWLDASHLLLFPVARVVESNDRFEYTQSVVMNLITHQSWIPVMTGATDGCDLPLWSNSLQELIATDGHITLLTTAEGVLIDQLEGGGPLDLSPSGQRLLSGSFWHDLKSGETVNLGTSVHGYFSGAGWTSDERHLFTCCFIYGDVDTHSVTQVVPGVEIIGHGIPTGYQGQVSHWVLEDTRVIIEEWFSQSGLQGVIPLIDPLGQNFETLNVPISATSTEELTCGMPSLSPDHQYLLAQCRPPELQSDRADLYLMELDSLVATKVLTDVEYTPSVNSWVDWSPDSQYGLTSKIGRHYLISTSDSSATLLTNSVIVPPTWNPDSRHLAYLDKKRLLLTVQLVTTGDMRQIILPASGAAEWWNRGLIWNPQGTALAIPLKDRGLWLLPSLAASTNLVQITPALPEIHSVRWSPDGSQIAFISGEDVYIVSVGGTP